MTLRNLPTSTPTVPTSTPTVERAVRAPSHAWVTFQRQHELPSRRAQLLGVTRSRAATKVFSSGSGPVEVTTSVSPVWPSPRTK